MIKKYLLKESLSSNTVFSSFYGSPTEKNLKAIINMYGEDNQVNTRKQTRNKINTSLEQLDLKELRATSVKFYTTNLIYLRFVEYFANMLCFYWMVTPRIRKMDNALNNDIIIEKWWDVLSYIEDINPESIGPYIARKVLLDGACYIAVREKTSKKTAFGIQYLPINYCRVTKRYLDRDVIDFNVKYFEDKFRTLEDRNVALEAYPPCISEKYLEWKRSKNQQRGSEWVTIDPDYGFRFTLRPDEVPFFIGTVLDLLDLQDVKDITMFKLEQELSKILVQKFGTNSDGNPIVDLDVLKQFHSETSQMLKNIPGVDVITTYADVDSVDLKASENENANNPINKIVANVYNSAGISQLLFNADNAGTLTKSVILDESIMFSLLKQFNGFLKARIQCNFRKGKIGKALDFGITMPEITYGNQKDMIKLYKEQASIGYSKFLPAIALGQRQSDIMSALLFENNILDLINMMRPPASSNTVSSNPTKLEKKDAGRPPKDDDEISEKTVKNKETL